MLAQASFKSPSHVRYGQDYYDQRTKATRVVTINSDTPEKSTVSIHHLDKANSIDEVDSTSLPTPPTTPFEEKQKQPVDPLHWFGILVPPPLRNAQASFVAVIQGPVDSASNASISMRRIEHDIRRLRKDIKRAEKRRLE